MSDKAKAMERLIQSVVTGEKLRTATNAELADLMREHVWAGLMMCSAVADLVGEAMDRLRGLKTCASCHGWGYVEHVRCAICDGTGDVEPRARETGGAVREAAAKLNATGEEMARLDENNVADSFAALHVLAPRFIREAKALLSALSSPPRPATRVVKDYLTTGQNGAPPADAATEAVPLRAEDVEWVVNSIAELGVKIGDHFFFLYKGESLVYTENQDDEPPLMWRHVGKREFGECCHPINDADPTKYGTVDVKDGRKWRPLVSTPAPAPSADRCAAGHDWIRRGEGSCGDRYVCLRCGERKP